MNAGSPIFFNIYYFNVYQKSITFQVQSYPIAQKKLQENFLNGQQKNRLPLFCPCFITLLRAQRLLCSVHTGKPSSAH